MNTATRACALVASGCALFLLVARFSSGREREPAAARLVKVEGGEVTTRGGRSEHGPSRADHPDAPAPSGIVQSYPGGAVDKYPFFPHGGRLGRDLWVNNYADLDPGGGVLDWDCSSYTYDTHRGHDSEIRSFDEQAVGVPVFAVLDGVVTSIRDGEPDQNTSCTGIGNHVVLSHGGSHETRYWHLKTNSVAVQLGEQVTAGTYLGDTGSSGCSTHPHLHFESRFDGAWFEPSTGPCHPGESTWLSQEPVARQTYVTDFTFSNTSLSGWAPPFGFPSRSGHTLNGLRSIYFAWFQKNLPPSSGWQVVFRRPDGSTAFASSPGSFGNAGFLRSSYWLQQWTIDFSVTGTWHVELIVNGASMLNAPLEVVTSVGAMANRPPGDLDGVVLEPSDPTVFDPLRCRIETSLVTDDPDYDLVAYRYVWRVDGDVVRDVTHAGHADVLRKGSVATASTVECSVTPTDLSANGNTVVTSVLVTGGGTVDEVCAGGAAISKAKLVLSKLGGVPGDESVTFGGRLQFGAGEPADLTPLDAIGRGAQLLIEDMGDGGRIVYELTHRTSPIPAGAEAPVCDARRKDGWRANAKGTAYVYANRTGRLLASGCASGSARGLKTFKWNDRRGASAQGIDFSLKAANAAVPRPIGPLRATVVLGAAASAGVAGECGTVSFGVCVASGSGTTMVCRQ